MALPLKINFSKCLKKLVVLRIIKHGAISLHSLKYSSEINRAIKNREPVKYTANEAYKIQISETIGFKEEKKDFKTELSKKIVLLSTFATFFYFFLFREENEIDDILKGKKTPELELLDLKLKLNYCKQMKLPTDAIKARIEELEKSTVQKPVITR